jgi:glutathione S-transferase
MQIYAKGLEGQIALVEPPGGTSSQAYLALNPLGRVPALEVDGIVIPESEVICEYLEDRFPEPPLRPADLHARARVRFMSRFGDLDLQRTYPPLFSQLDPATRDPDALRKGLDDLYQRLDQLEGFLSTGPYAVGDQLTLPDCALAPLLWFVIGTRMCRSA